MRTVHLLSTLLPLVLFVSCTGSRPRDLGVRDGGLAPCPSTPNCVSSRGDGGHAIAPLRFSGPSREAMARLAAIINGMPRARIVTDNGSYIHAEFTSLVFRFVDDAEFLLDENDRVIHVRSASRLGRSDLGVNRRRIEDIRAAWDRRP